MQLRFKFSFCKFRKTTIATLVPPVYWYSQNTSLFEIRMFIRVIAIVVLALCRHPNKYNYV